MPVLRNMQSSTQPEEQDPNGMGGQNSPRRAGGGNGRRSAPPPVAPPQPAQMGPFQPLPQPDPASLAKPAQESLYGGGMDGMLEQILSMLGGSRRG